MSTRVPKVGSGMCVGGRIVREPSTIMRLAAVRGVLVPKVWYVSS